MKKMDTNQVDTGKLQIQVNTSIQNRPINQATISISYTGNPSETLEQVTTDSNGRSPVLELPTPPLEYSMAPNENQPYSEYTIRVSAEGFAPVDISGSELLPGETSVQPVQMIPEEPEIPFEDIVIPAHTLFGEYPEKIPEDEIKPTNETGEIVLSRVVVPEYVIVHDGSPSDSTANNYYVRYRDYIKNVASSEIYATWPENTIRANVLAIMSFTLNRVYTEWYRNKGYDFTITSSTAFDHKWIHGRNFFDSISQVVDEVFSNYLSRPNVRQPILTQLDESMGIKVSGRSGILHNSDYTEFLWAGYVHQQRRRNFRRALLLARLQSDDRFYRTKGYTITGTVKHHCRCLQFHPRHQRGWNLRGSHAEFCSGLSVPLWTACYRNR